MYTQHWQGILYGKQRIVPELNKAEGRKKSITNATSCSVPPPKEHLHARRLSTTINMEFGETVKFAICKRTKVTNLFTNIK
jgi:hypothetical protein